MKDDKTLRKAIDKAVENNWLDLNLGLLPNDYICTLHNKIHILGTFRHFVFSSLFEIIFSHSFVKAFWGEELVCRICGTPKSEKQSIAFCDGCLTPILSEQDEKYYYIYKWQRHLQQMVLCENPLQYLANFL